MHREGVDARRNMRHPEKSDPTIPKHRDLRPPRTINKGNSIQPEVHGAAEKKEKIIRRRILVLKEDKKADRKYERADNNVGKGVKVEEVRLGTKDLWHGCGLPEYLFPSSTGLPNRRETP